MDKLMIPKFPYKAFDLTHTVSPKTPTWEGDCGFFHTLVLDYSDCTAPVQFRVQKINMLAGLGTHMDAPAHCVSGGRSIEDFTLNELISPCVVIDVSARVHELYSVTRRDIELFESEYGKINSGTFVLIRTGWEQFWSSPEKYRNEYRFPSVSIAAIEQLLDRNIVGLGIDTLSPDRPTDGYAVHAALLNANKFIIENVANSKAIPATGSFILVLPMKIEGGTEAPIRLIALVKDK